MPVDVEQFRVDLLSFTAHKIYGPKGVGALYVRSRGPRVRLEPQIDGGGQEGGLRSGTLNVPGIVGLARAMELCLDEAADRAARGCAACATGSSHGLSCRPVRRLAQRAEPGTARPAAAGQSQRELRLCRGRSAAVERLTDIALSTGSACTSANPEPSHVLRSLGLSEDAVRGSVRFGLGRFNTAEEVEEAVARIAEAVSRLRKMSSLAE